MPSNAPGTPNKQPFVVIVPLQAKSRFAAVKRDKCMHEVKNSSECFSPRVRIALENNTDVFIISSIYFFRFMYVKRSSDTYVFMASYG
jgi:hypothetical protein